MIAKTVLALLLLQGDAPPAQDGRRKVESYRDLIENNLFSPPKKAPKPADPAKPAVAKPVEPSKPDPIVVTGFVLNAAEKRYEAVIEDRKKKEIRFCKAGDVVEGWTLSVIEQSRMVAKGADREREFKVGETLNGDPAAVVPATADKKEAAAEGEVAADKIEEARKRRREQFGKKSALEDEEDTETEKRNKKPR